MLTATIDLRNAQGALQRIPQEVADAVAAKVRTLTTNLQHHVIADKLQGQVLHHRSGALARSIQTNVETSGQVTTGEVYSSGDVKYAAIHEFGGTTAAHDILPSKAEALAFVIGGQQVFARVVHHPGSKMPERSFLRSSLADMADLIVDGIKQAATKGAKMAMGQ